MRLLRSTVVVPLNVEGLRHLEFREHASTRQAQSPVGAGSTGPALAKRNGPIAVSTKSGIA